VAEPFILGGTGGTGTAQELILGLSSGGSVTFNTSQGEFTAGTLNQGWWSDFAGNSNDNDNIIVGSIQLDNLVANYNDFFTFLLSEIQPGSVVSATLRINDVGFGAGPFPVTYSLFDVSTDARVLNFNDVGSPNLGIFGDLGSGVLYASTGLNGNPSSPFDIVLDASAVADINGAAGGYFSIGGTLTPGSVQEVPEPGTVALLGIALAVMAAARRRSN
jgi:hypothetical protein